MKRCDRRNLTAVLAVLAFLCGCAQSPAEVTQETAGTAAVDTAVQEEISLAGVSTEA